MSGAQSTAKSLRKKLVREFSAAFGRTPDFIARAPGRIEFIGNHTDYNGGTVLGAAIDRGICVAIASRADGKRRFCSAKGGKILTVPATKPVRQSGARSWLNYPLGVIAALPKFGLKAPAGFDLLVWSDLPTGAGLSSSAALELSSALAFLAVTGQNAALETTVTASRAPRIKVFMVGLLCVRSDKSESK